MIGFTKEQVKELKVRFGNRVIHKKSENKLIIRFGQIVQNKINYGKIRMEITKFDRGGYDFDINFYSTRKPIHDMYIHPHVGLDVICCGEGIAHPYDLIAQGEICAAAELVETLLNSPPTSDGFMSARNWEK